MNSDQYNNVFIYGLPHQICPKMHNQTQESLKISLSHFHFFSVLLTTSLSYYVQEDVTEKEKNSQNISYMIYMKYWHTATELRETISDQMSKWSFYILHNDVKLWLKKK